MEPGIIAAIVAGGCGLIVLASGLRVVKDYQRGVVLRLGRRGPLLEPGLRYILPLGIDRLTKVDLRSAPLEVPAHEVITHDGVPVRVSAAVHLQVLNPMLAVTRVVDYRGSDGAGGARRAPRRRRRDGAARAPAQRRGDQGGPLPVRGRTHRAVGHPRHRCRRGGGDPPRGDAARHGAPGGAAAAVRAAREEGDGAEPTSRDSSRRRPRSLPTSHTTSRCASCRRSATPAAATPVSSSCHFPPSWSSPSWTCRAGQQRGAAAASSPARRSRCHTNPDGQRAGPGPGRRRGTVGRWAERHRQPRATTSKLLSTSRSVRSTSPTRPTSPR